MRREVSARLVMEAEAPVELVFSLSPALGYELADESFRVTQDGRELPWTVAVDNHGTRLHLVRAEAGPIGAAYAATVAGAAAPIAVEELDAIRYLRPSRYCESDALGPTALAEFGGLHGAALLAAVSSWVGTRLSYVPGSSLPTDGALQTLLGRRGVCRDYAHLVVAFLRALDVPARVVSAYAPGLSPMDFHAVAEALIDGSWRVVDATALAPRGTLVRIASGRDAADTAFLTSIGGSLQLRELEVTAVADELPGDVLDELAHVV